MWRVAALLLLLGIVAVDARLSHRVQPAVLKKEPPVAHGGLSPKLEEEAVPAMVAKVAGDLAVEWVAGAVYDHVTADRSGSCVIVSQPIDTTSMNNIRIVEDSFLHLCKAHPVRLEPQASEERQWHFHGHEGILMNKCSFDFKWQFSGGGTVFDCSKEALGEAGVKQAIEMFPYMANNPGYFTRYVRGIKVDILDCRLENHQGYVRVFPALPEKAFATNIAEASRVYARHPYFFINIEGWTGTDCLEEKVKPGVAWVFTYKVDLKTGVISYVTKFNRWEELNFHVSGTAGRRVPYTTEPMWVPYLYGGETQRTKREVDTYQFRARRMAERLRIPVKQGSWTTGTDHDYAGDIERARQLGTA